jgi:molybdopterin-guanine dinucleotide biosynthesis protein A
MDRKISGAILAGGAGSRFNGLMKPKIVIDGVTIISRMLSAMTGIFDEILIVTNNPSEFEEYSFCRIIPDEINNAGPLGGIHSALKASSNEAVFVCAGDMPFLEKRLIIEVIEAYLSAGCDVLIPQIEEFIEPLHSVYNTALVKVLEDYLDNNNSFAVREFIKTLNIRYFPLEGSKENKKAFTNINSPSDIFTAGRTGNRSLLL